MNKGVEAVSSWERRQFGTERRTAKVNAGTLQTVGEKCLSVDGKYASARKVANDVDVDWVQ
jgi:hypothetical protein